MKKIILSILAILGVGGSVLGVGYYNQVSNSVLSSLTLPTSTLPNTSVVYSNNGTLLGSANMTFNGNGLTITTSSMARGLFATGTAALPSLSFTNDPNTGFYDSGSDIMYFSSNGAAALQLGGGSVLYSNSIYSLAATFLTLQGLVADGATAIGAKIGSYSTLSTAGSKLVSLVNNTTEKAYIDYTGVYNGGLNSGSYEFTADGGALYGFYLPLSTATAGTEESITTMIGTTWQQKFYCENTGSANATKNCSIRSYVPTVQVPDPSVTTTAILNNTTLPLTFPMVLVQGSGGATTSIALPFLTTSTAENGMEITIVGMSDTNTVTIQDKVTLANSGLNLNSSPIVIGAGDVVKLVFDSVNGWWNLVNQNLLPVTFGAVTAKTVTTTLTAAEVCNSNVITVTAVTSSPTITFPTAASLFANCLGANGNSHHLTLINLSPTSTTFAVDTGGTLSGTAVLVTGRILEANIVRTSTANYLLSTVVLINQ
jgi:hypothetical protein